MMDGTGTMSWFGMGFGGLGIIFWLVLIIAGIFAIVRWLAPPAQGGANKSAVDILKERYARGDVDKETFETMRRDLEE